MKHLFQEVLLSEDEQRVSINECVKIYMELKFEDILVEIRTGIDGNYKA